MESAFYPLVSIVIPVYNGSNYLREAIQCALEQTYPNIEVLVINDGSTDHGATRDIAMSFSGRIRYFEKENGGVVSALNFGIDQMRGEYFSWLSHDDIYLPKKIEKQVLAIQEQQGEKPAFCICNCILMDENGSELGRSRIQRDQDFDKPECFLLLGGQGFSGIMVLISKILFDTYGQFTPSLSTHEYDMWLRLMPAADVVVEPECLTKMRIHSQQISRQKKQAVAEETDRFVCSRIQNIPPLDFQRYTLSGFHSNGIRQMTELINSYLLYQNLPASTTQLIAQLRCMYLETKAGDEDFFMQLLGASDSHAAKSYCRQRNHTDKPLVVIFCEHVQKEAMEEVSIAIALLAMQYEIVLLYHQIEESQRAALKEIGVMPIALTAFDQNTPLRLGILSYFLNAKMFWYVDVPNDMRDTMVFRLLKVLNIRAIASVSDIDAFLVNRQKEYSEEHDERVKQLLEALLITNSKAEQLLITDKHWKFVAIPSQRLSAVACWKSIFDVLLGTANYSDVEKEIDNRILTGSIGSKTELADYIKEYIQRYLLAVDQRVAVAIDAYEQRTFWKLTKPLRIGMWFIRKSGKAIHHVFKDKESMRSIASRTRVALKNRSVSE